MKISSASIELPFLVVVPIALESVYVNYFRVACEKGSRYTLRS
ncbi:MAG: hypothetical protein K0S74_113 [Chlamydiales bacterium]|jgi:hypothetical protein|nr:hypothetical protein [Chlamydiales bacterium]